MNRVAQARAILKKAKIKPNQSELYLLEVLRDYFPEFQFIFNEGQVIIEGLIPDFICTNHQKVLIELIGNQNLPKHQPEALSSRQQLFSKYGFRTIFIYHKYLRDEDSLLDELFINLYPGGK